MTHRVLDVRPEDLEAATTALQRLALALFEELFDGGPGVTGRWFASSDARVLDRVPRLRLEWRRMLARRARTSNPAGWSGGAVRARLALDAHGAEGLRIPDRLLALVARAAWECPTFRVQASTLVLNHFRSRLIAPGDGFVPRIAPNLVWMIVATARVTPPPLVRLGVAHRAARRALARLQGFGYAVLDETALPDDFWSHWIAWHVERQYGQRSKLPPEWHSRLSAADRSGATSIGAKATEVIDPLAAVYAAWYPTNRRVARVRLDPRS
jgi:hypothetical protein